MSFQEHYVEADGFRIRYMEAGQGEPVVWFHGGGGLQMNRLHDLLAEKQRVLAFEVPGFGASPLNERTKSMEELAGTMGKAIAALGIDKYSVMGISFGGKLALWTEIVHPDKVQAAVLLAPAAIRPANTRPPANQAEMTALLYAHPERLQPETMAAPNAEERKKGMGLAMRIIGPDRDAALEAKMKECKVPTLVLMGTEDRLIPAAMGRHYREIMQDCYVVMVYDAAHALDVERPEACFAVIDDFLSRQGKFVVSNEDSALYP